jgi:hypothetical protein
VETSKLKRFAQFARRLLIEQVSSRLEQVLRADSRERRESPDAVKRLENNLEKIDSTQLVERVAYIWFNRFCALRFMDLNRYNPLMVLSPLDGHFQPEILAEAKNGYINPEIAKPEKQEQIFNLLNGKTPGHNPQNEAYRLLLVAACNYWGRIMPFLFSRIEDDTELLMPDDMLSGSSIIAYTREAMTPGVCRDVEVIGWLYQFYISEKKDEIFNGLKKNKKINPENIPAATQLFTPNWIVRYLVQNSLGRLWLLNNPDSELAQKMEYYIPPENVADSINTETSHLKISSPEEIKVCDPACGSGHMLVYAFDLLYDIYEEEGYSPAQIPEKILTNNLYGIEIDERAGELAAFALVMCASAKNKQFLRQPVQPHICILENVEIKAEDLQNYMDYVGHNLSTQSLQSLLGQFAEADNFGSLIRPKIKDVAKIKTMLAEKNMSGHAALGKIHKQVEAVLKQADYLSPKYHVVIANPPYMGGKGMNPRLTSWVRDNYPDSKSDLFAMFIERNLELAKKQGLVGMITMQSWMFLSSYEKLRNRLLSESTISSMAHLGARGFDSIGGEVVSTTAFVLENYYNPEYKGAYIRLVDGNSESEKLQMLKEAIKSANML